MAKDKNKKATSSYGHLLQAYKVAKKFYYSRSESGELPKQRDLAKEMNLSGPRFSEYLNTAWKADLVDIIVRHPDMVNPDIFAVEDLEAKLLEKLQPYSPPLLNDKKEKIREHKLSKVHIVPNTTGQIISDYPYYGDNVGSYGGLAARVCSKAAQKLLEIINEEYDKFHPEKGKEDLFCGVGWGRTCERIINLLEAPEPIYERIVVCPLVGLIGTKNASIDANFLALRLAAKLASRVIKLPVPGTQPLDMNIERLAPVSRALEQINQCTVAVSGVGVAYNKKEPKETVLLHRKVIEPEQLEKIVNSKAIAEIHCHHFDGDGNEIAPEELGFKAVGVSVDDLRRIPRMLVSISPRRSKILPAVVSVKAGICSELVIDHVMARYILTDENNDELGL